MPFCAVGQAQNRDKRGEIGAQDDLDEHTYLSTAVPRT